MSSVNSAKLLIIRMVTFLSGLYFLLEFLLPKQIGGSDSGGSQGGGFVFGAYHEPISNGFTAVAACAVGLGIINLFLHHGKKILWRDSGAIYSFTLLMSLVLTLWVLSVDWLSSLHVAKQVSYFSMLSDYTDRVSGTPQEEARREKQLLLVQAIQQQVAIGSVDPVLSEKGVQLSALVQEEPLDPTRVKTSLQEYGQLLRAANESTRTETLAAKISKILIDGLFTALGSAMFSLLGFYIAAAAYRAFRVRSLESALLMITAIIVMLGQIPFGIMLWDGMPQLRLWFLQVPSSAAARAIEIGASIAGLILAFRMWLSIESRSFRSK